MKSAEKRRLIEESYIDFFILAMSILRDADDAKDAVQEAIVGVLSARRVDDVKNYTFQAVRNAAVNILRHRSKFAPLGENIMDVAAAQDEHLKALAQARDELPEDLRALVELHDEEDYSLEELNKMTGLSVSKLRRRLIKAHEIIKKRMEEER